MKLYKHHFQNITDQYIKNLRLVASQHKLRQLRVSPYLLYNQMMGLLCSILLLLTTVTPSFSTGACAWMRCVSSCVGWH